MVRLYADANATSPLSDAAKSAMLGAMDLVGNPSSAHAEGRAARALLEKSRTAVAATCRVPPIELVFTSGGSEANHLALVGSYYAHKTSAQAAEPFEIVVSAVEHSSIVGAIAFLQTEGVRVRKLGLDATGRPDALGLEALLRERRAHLVSVMAANNETGIVSPIDLISQTCRRFGATLHVDAVQAFGKVPANRWNIADLISLSAHKIQGPKGVGALLIRGGKKLVATHFGGTQETKRRGGTENLIGIAGFGAAAAACADDTLWGRTAALRAQFEKALAAEPHEIIGEKADRLPNTCLVRFPGVAAEVLLGALDLEGVAVSTGSACSSGSIAPSPVLLAMGFEADAAREALRVSFGPWFTPAQIDTLAASVVGHVRRVRARRANANTRLESRV